MERGELVDALRQSRESLLQAVNGLDATSTTLRPAADEWSVVEILAHLVDTDYFYLGEALAAAATEGHHFRHFDDDAWKATHPEAGRLHLDTVLSALAASHAAVIGSIDRLSDVDLAQPCIHPRGIPYTAADAVYRLAPHDQNHEQQINATIAALAPR